MDQEDAMDFKALRAKFQDEEILLRQPRPRPVLPDKPKVAPRPQSPTHHLPAGARPSLLTSIGQNLEGKAPGAPRVIFKEDKKDSRKPLIPLTPKIKEKNATKPKSIKGSKEKPDAEEKDSSKQKSGKDKKGLLHFMAKESTELVPASPPPKSTLKKVFPGFKKPGKRLAVEALVDPILDSPSPNLPSGLAPLIPSGYLPSEGAPAAAHTLNTGAPFVPAIPDYNAMSALMPPTFLPLMPPSGPSRASLVADVPAPRQETETPPEMETPVPPGSDSPRAATPTAVLPSTPRPSSPVFSSVAAPSPTPSGPSTPSPQPGPISAGAGAEPDHDEEKPPAMATADDAASVRSSPNTERPASTLSSALERAVDMNPGKRPSTGDQRILNALEKARRKAASPLTMPSTSYPVTPTPEELPPPGGLADFPPVDYEYRARNPEAARVNGFEHSMSEDGSDVVPDLMVVPPPPPRRTLPDPQVLGPPSEKPARPPNVNLTPYLPPPLEAEEIPTPQEYWEQTETSEGLPEFEDTHSPELHSPQSSEYAWGNEDYSTPNGHNHGSTLPDTRNSALYSNGLPYAGGEAYRASTSEFGEPGFREIPEVEQSQDAFDSSAHSAQDDRSISMLQPNNDTLEGFGNFYEDVNVSATKKKVKVEGMKKRKGPPKNPYDETPKPTNEEKSKTGRLVNFKKATAEGPEEKELKKKEKQRLEKEKKEQKEQKEQKEREKREQKEKEKRENEMKKKFNITGQEEAMYRAMVTVTTKGSKNNLPVTSGDNISIIRTTKCPKGKWLARNHSNTYGYIAVDHVELDIKEMMEMGKRATGTTHQNSSRSVLDAEASSPSSRHSNNYPQSTGSFTDDSEEWSGDDEDPLSPTDSVEPFTPQGHTRTHSLPEIGNKELSVVHQHSHSDISTEGPHTQAKHEALQKLATFFHAPKPVAEEPTTSIREETSDSHTLVDEGTVSSPESPPTEEADDDMLILPPPELYADTEPVTPSL